MEIEEAVEWQKKFKQSYQSMPLAKPKVDEVWDFTIAALEELQQYRKIGKVDECRIAREKQIAKTPDYEGDGYSEGELVIDTWICPNCGEYYEIDYDHHKYCPKCGQHIQHEGWESE